MAAPKQSSTRDVKPVILSLFVAVCLTLAVLSLFINLSDQGVFGPTAQPATATPTWVPRTPSGETHSGQGQGHGEGEQHSATATADSPAGAATATPRPTLVPHTPQATLPDPED